MAFDFSFPFWSRRVASRGGSPYHIGLDLGERRTKIVGVVEGEQGITVTHAIDVATPEGLIRDRRVVDAAAVAQHIGAVAKQYGFSGAKLSVVVPASDVRLQRFALPRSDAASMLRAVEAEPALQLGGSERVETRYAFADLDPEGEYSEPGLTTLLAVSGRSDTIVSLQSAVDLAGLERDLVRAAPLALAKAWAAAHPERVLAGSRSVLLHGGYGGMTVVVLDGDVPATAYDASLGVEFLMERSGLNGRVRPEGEASLFQPGSPLTDDLLLEEWVRRVVGEVRRVAGSMSAGSGILGDADGSGALWISGGIARLPAIADRFHEALGIPVERFDPLSEYDASAAAGAGDPFGPALAVAMGLALESLSPGERGIHLDLSVETAGRPGAHPADLPPREVARAAVRDPLMMGAVALAVAVLIGIQVAEARQASRIEQVAEQRTAVLDEARRLRSSLKRAEQLSAEQARLVGTVRAIEALDPDRYAWVRLMDRIGTVIPPNVWLGGRDALSMQSFDPLTGIMSFRIQGYAPSVELAAAFERRLSAGAPVLESNLSGTQSTRIGGFPVVHLVIEGRVGGGSVVVGPAPGDG